MSERAVRGVIFDLFGTLVTGVQSGKFRSLIGEMAEALGLPGQEFDRGWVETAEDRYRGKFKSVQENIEAVLGLLGKKASREEIQRAVDLRTAHTSHELEPKSEAEDVLRALRSQGLKIGLISDCSPGVPELWKRCSLSAFVDVPVFSSDAGLKKPDPRIYRLALDPMGLASQDCLYVGDGGSKELTGATAVGLRAILIEPSPGTVVSGYGWESHTWTGPRIQSLHDVIRFL